MKIKALVELHDKFSIIPHAVKENCGDGYLCYSNSLYNNVRKLALANGTTYSKTNTDNWNNYMVFPLLSFPELIEKRVIPYIDNISIFRHLAEQHPEMAIPENYIISNYKRNYLLHESCHCIADEFLKKNPLTGELAQNPKLSAYEKPVNSILSESFANSIERMSLSISKSKALIFFHVLNSYFAYHQEVNELFEKARSEVGVPSFFKIIFIIYFFNNLLGYEHSKSNIESIIDRFGSECGLPDDTAKRETVAAAIFRGCELNPGFREGTSLIYFTYLDLEKEYRSLNAEFVLSNKEIADCLSTAANEMCDMILSGTKL